MGAAEHVFAGPAGQLAGTLITPGEGSPSPAVLLMPGSGPVDRNEDHRKTRLGFFPALAERLAAAGIASFRYDKRGTGTSAGDFWSTGLHDGIADHRAAIAWLRTHEDIDPDRIFVLGHSEGAIVAPQLLAEDRCLAGGVLIAGETGTGFETLELQGRRIQETVTGFPRLILRLLRIDPVRQQRKLLARIAQSTSDTIRAGGQRINARWMREFFEYDSAPFLAQISVPVLAITGAKDLQVDPASLAVMAELCGATTHCPPNLTHILRDDLEPPSIAHYDRLLREPVSEELLGLVADWLTDETQAPEIPREATP